ncbi:hypothetical protein ACWDA9_38090, partial [Streptomyces sp. NPDC001193]
GEVAKNAGLRSAMAKWYVTEQIRPVLDLALEVCGLEAALDGAAEDGAADPTGWVDGPQAAVSPAATTAAATSGSRIPRGVAGRGGCVRRSARTGRSMRELMAKTPQDTDRNAGGAGRPPAR